MVASTLPITYHYPQLDQPEISIDIDPLYGNKLFELTSISDTQLSITLTGEDLQRKLNNTVARPVDPNLQLFSVYGEKMHILEQL